MIRSILAACALTWSLSAVPAHAQTDPYPSKPIRLVVGYSAGGASDIMARTVGKQLSERLGQPVVVENRAGAASNLAAEAVAKAPPDGYTLLLGTIALSINPSLYKNLPFDSLKDFAPVAGVASTPFMLVAHPATNIRTVAELVQAAKAAKQPLLYASAGAGSGANLFMEYLKSAAGIDLAHVPYRGTPPALADVLGGRVPLTFDNIITTWPLVKEGKLNGLAVSTATRAKIAPDVPTLEEAGIKGFDATAWFGVFAPAGTPPNIVRRLNAAIVEGLKDRELRETLLAQGSEPMSMSPEAFAAFFRNEVARWQRVIADAHIRIEQQ